MLTDIAEGLGNAARNLASTSRSDVGTLAVKSVKVDIEFEMATRRTADGTQVGLGVRTFAFGFGVDRNAVDERRINRGRVELEIVAVPLAAPSSSSSSPAPVPAEPEPPAPPPTGPTPAERMREAVALLRARVGGLDIPVRARREIERRMAAIDKLIDNGDLAAATNQLVDLGPVLDQLTGWNG